MKCAERLFVSSFRFLSPIVELILESIKASVYSFSLTLKDQLEPITAFTNNTSIHLIIHSIVILDSISFQNTFHAGYNTDFDFTQER